MVGGGAHILALGLDGLEDGGIAADVTVDVRHVGHGGGIAVGRTSSQRAGQDGHVARMLIIHF